MREEQTVMLRLLKWRGAFGRAVLLAMVAALIPLPVAAAESRPSDRPGAIKASVEKIAASDFAVNRTNRASAVRKQQGSGQDKSFFKTKPGILALAVMIGGVGYAIY